MDDDKRNNAVKIICFAVAGLFAAGVVACIIALVYTRLDVLFIPISLCAVGLMISLTYGFMRRS